MDPFYAAVIGAVFAGVAMIGGLAIVPWIDRVAETIERRLRRR